MLARGRGGGGPRARPVHLGEGLVAGGERVVRGIADGLTGIVARPLEGAAADGLPGFLAGLATGAVGAVAAPVAVVSRQKSSPW